MIRIIISTLLIIASLISASMGTHPSWSILGIFIAIILIGWYCVNKYEDDMFVSLK